MAKEDIKKDDFSFEERDDERTTTGELVPDCEKPFETVEISPVLEYLGEFKALIDACGQVSYFMNMENLVKADVNKAKIIASAYQHDLEYYKEQFKEWKEKAKRSFIVLSMHAGKLGYKLPNEKDFLNGLTLMKDRRDAYKDYLSTCLKHEKTLSPFEMEKKFQLRLKKRLKKKK